MKLLQELTKPDFEWEVPSKSEKGTFHKVSFSEIQGWECDCYRWKYNRECRHIRIIKNKFNENYEPKDY